MKLVPFGSVIHETLWDVMFSSLLDLFSFDTSKNFCGLQSVYFCEAIFYLLWHVRVAVIWTPGLDSKNLKTLQNVMISTDQNDWLIKTLL